MISVSSPKISKATDRAMDKAASKARPLPANVSIRNGPVTDDAMDIDSTPNGASKRKSRSSLVQSVNYKDDSDSEDGAPLVGGLNSFQEHRLADWNRPNVKGRAPKSNQTATMSRLLRRVALDYPPRSKKLATSPRTTTSH